MKQLLYFGIGMILILVSYVLYHQIQKFKLISGFAAKNMASSVFVAHRNATITQQKDNGTPLIKLAKCTIDWQSKSVTATVFGLFPKTAYYIEGVGAILANQKPTQCTIPQRNKTPIQLPYPYGNLPEITTKQPNINYKQLAKAIEPYFTKNANNPLPNTRALVVLYKGQLIAEQYAPGFDEKSLLQGWSITKSLLTTCFGVLAKNGYDIHKPISTLKDWQFDERKNITTSDLLRMESGLTWEEDYGKICDVTTMLFDDEDVTQRPIQKKLIHPIGSNFNYASGSSNILTAVLRKQFKTTQAYLNFPYQAIFDKIGMHSLLIETDATQNFIASSYSWATARDWAKFGELMRLNGKWNGEQILDPHWVHYITTPNNSSKGEYGGQWWLNNGQHMKKIPKSIFYSDGFQGQRIFVVPSHDLVIVRFGITNLKREAFYPVFDNMINHIIKSIKP